MTRALLGLTLTLILATASVFVLSTDETGAVSESLDGETLFLAKGCVGCHQRGALGQIQIGPNLTHLAERAASRVEGLDAEAYVRQSVLDPQAYVVSGHEATGSMPTLTLTNTELDALVDFLLESEPSF